MQRRPSPPNLEQLEHAEKLKLSGKHVEALALLEGLLIEDPSNVTVLEEIADNELSLSRFGRAETAARRAAALDEKSYTAHYILGFLHSQRSAWQEAMTHLRLANSLKPNNAEILRCLGWALWSAGRQPQGMVTLERALNLESDNPLTLCDLGVVYLEVQNFAKSKALFLRALDIEPDNTRARECVEAVERLERKLKQQSLVK